MQTDNNGTIVEYLYNTIQRSAYDMFGLPVRVLQHLQRVNDSRYDSAEKCKEALASILNAHIKELEAESDNQT